MQQRSTSLSIFATGSADAQSVSERLAQISEDEALRSLKDGHTVYISVERGQFLTGSYGLERYAAVKFDDGKIQKFSTAGSSSGNTNVMSIQGYDRFVRQLRRAKTVSIEAEFFHEARHVIHFDVAGLSWKQ